MSSPLASTGMDRDLLRRAISVVDLTDLADHATSQDATALCDRAAAAPTAAVCVWPRFVAASATHLADTGVRVATVVNFPGGDQPIADVVAATRRALGDGADEIDVVLPYRAWLDGDDGTAAAVLDAVRRAVDVAVEARASDDAAGRAQQMKVIIETGELPDRAAIDRAAHFAIAHGADFVKTSTGKTPVSATPDAAEIVLEALEVSGRRVGFKASGGIRTAADAAVYLDLADRIMGAGWATPATFRFGASALLDALQDELHDPT